jgi:hypothetical protein
MNEEEHKTQTQVFCNDCAVVMAEKLVREAVEPFYDDESASEELSEWSLCCFVRLHMTCVFVSHLALF